MAGQICLPGKNSAPFFLLASNSCGSGCSPAGLASGGSLVYLGDK